MDNEGGVLTYIPMLVFVLILQNKEMPTIYSAV